jgi:hypothetical protein
MLMNRIERMKYRVRCVLVIEYNNCDAFESLDAPGLTPRRISEMFWDHVSWV